MAVAWVAALAVAPAACSGDSDSPSAAPSSPATVIVTVPVSGPSTTVSGQPTKTAFVAAPGSVQGFAAPRSVVVVDNTWFVSNLGLNPAVPEGAGFLSVLSDAGTVTNRTAVPRAGEPPLTSPSGMAYVNGTLYVADTDRVVGFDPRTYARVFDAPVGGAAPARLSGIAALDDKTLLVTDSVSGTVYQLHTEDNRFDVLATQIPGAKGIAVDQAHRVAYVGASGSQSEGGDLYRLELGAGTVTSKKVGSVRGLLDGVLVLPNGNIAVSDWVGPDQPGTVRVYRPDGTEVSKVSLPAALRGPAGIAVDAAGKNLLVPAQPDNTLTIVALN
ncbi:SMP-30/gluconolactonase/LRE family protein [Nocardia sp. XZ_19_385]|uniref:SMP-30/gluconolactonase/LRE family protein n=1 Tax=Nocardia sp. XZ_19_385 TaxID=2769488 RepID=UPI00188FF257|nr:hypothetical protein [Nocardia sp. XZ_19_385]